MSRSQDTVIDDEETETCPLCIEDLDISDRNFRPCPCGYQICQFCYNNIKTTMNGLCPACRRQYDDKNIQWKVPTSEELATYKESVAQQAKKKAQARQKEAQRREADSLSRKHLAGIRVRQKNLVYVTGMKPQGSAERLADELRKPEYFGQYGEIVKIVVSKAKENHVGIYVTFKDKEAAALCIASVDGSPNQEQRLRAQYGTTKYCSAYLRGETCQNRSCMFLHEPGEENESFTRQDLSSMNVISTQSPAQANFGGSSSSSHLPQPQPPAPQPSQPVAAASQPMDRQGSREAGGSSADSSDGSALPSTANWARNAPSRRASHAQSSSSPLATSATPAAEKPEQAPGPKAPPGLGAEEMSAPSPLQRLARKPSLLTLLKQELANDDFYLQFDEMGLGEDELVKFNFLPSLIDGNGGARRLLAAQKFEEARNRVLDGKGKEADPVTLDAEEIAASGSHQLGGEPEDRPESSLDSMRHPHAIHPPMTGSLDSPALSLNHALSPALSNAPTNGRGLTPQQQQQLLLQQFKSASPNFLNQGSGQAHPGHARQSSRFSFANDTSASASVKPITNQKLLNQQSSMMPPSASQIGQPANGGFFSGSVQGPPPGLKATGTPPVSGGGMFGQGHGFATAGMYGMNRNDEMMRELLRNRGGSAVSAQASEAGRREYMFPSALHSSQSSTPAPVPGLANYPFGPSSGAPQEHGPQKHKRKGKKHRHANTSSSGGGVVDHADPSISQARMHQPGLYGGQGQGQGGQAGFNSMMYGNVPGHIPTSVAAQLFQDDHLDATASPSPFHYSDTRKSTPAVPPGLAIPFGRAPPGLGPASDQNQLDFNIMPELGRVSEGKTSLPANFATHAGKAGPSRGIASYVPRAASPPTNDESSFPSLPKATPAPAPAPTAATSKTKASKASKKAEPKGAESAATATATATATETSKSMDRKATSKSKSKKNATEPEGEIETTPGQDSKRQHPGKLDISAATAATKQAIADARPETSTASAPEGLGTPLSSRPGTPSLDTPLRRATQPRTLRVLATPTPKTETPPNTSPAPVAAVKTQHSAQPSIASPSVPGTPSGDRFQDDVSVTTGSFSRPGSPAPASRVGSAPVRTKTKNQMKKERQERAKALEEEKVAATGATSDTAPQDVVQEAITGRKKKQKKAKPAAAPKPAAIKTPEEAPSQAKATPPAAAEKVEEVAPAKDEAPAATATPAPEEATPVVTEKAPSPAVAEKEQTPEPSDTNKRPPFVDLVHALESLDAETAATIQDFFKPVSGLHSQRPAVDLPASLAEPPLPVQPPLTPEELADLDAGKPVRRGTKIGDRLLITPFTRKALKCLPAELEERVLALERNLRAAAPTLNYAHRPRNDAARAATSLVDEMLRDVTHQLSRPASKSKRQRTRETKSAESPSPSRSQPSYADDALSYLNQFILPSTPRGSAGIGAAIPRTYTTGDPTFSVSGVDVAPANYAYNTNNVTANSAIAAAAAMASSSELPAAAAEAADKLAQNLAYGKSLGFEGLDFQGNERLKSTLEGLAGALSGALGSLGAGAVPGERAAGGGGGMRKGSEVADAEAVLASCRREAEALEKRLMGVVRKNRRAAGMMG